VDDAPRPPGNGRGGTNGALTQVLRWLHGHFELGGSDQRLLPMEGLRGFAVALVFIQHFTMQLQFLFAPVGISGAIAKALSSYGNQGVELFFVLSG
jgi:exopolysaccharide production protein ExoZ